MVSTFGLRGVLPPALNLSDIGRSSDSVSRTVAVLREEFYDTPCVGPLESYRELRIRHAGSTDENILPVGP